MLGLRGVRNQVREKETERGRRRETGRGIAESWRGKGLGESKEANWDDVWTGLQVAFARCYCCPLSLSLSLSLSLNFWSPPSKVQTCSSSFQLFLLPIGEVHEFFALYSFPALETWCRLKRPVSVSQSTIRKKIRNNSYRSTALLLGFSFLTCSQDRHALVIWETWWHNREGRQPLSGIVGSYPFDEQKYLTCWNAECWPALSPSLQILFKWSQKRI